MDFTHAAHTGPISARPANTGARVTTCWRASCRFQRPFRMVSTPPRGSAATFASKVPCGSARQPRSWEPGTSSSPKACSTTRSLQWRPPARSPPGPLDVPSPRRDRVAWTGVRCSTSCSRRNARAAMPSVPGSVTRAAQTGKPLQFIFRRSGLRPLPRTKAPFARRCWRSRMGAATSPRR